MRITTLRGNQLTADHVEAWSALQRTDRITSNPFFSPEFTAAVADVRDDVEVACLDQGGEYVGFLSFQRDPRNVGRPVAARISELHGMVVRPGVEWSARQLLRETGLSAWHFECVPVSQEPLKEYHFCQRNFPFIDLSHGYEAYLDERRLSGSSLMKQASRKARKIEREIGPLRLESHTTDSNVFATLLAWKSARYKSTGTLDVFRSAWVVRLLERIRFMQTEHFSGRLSALYLGDEVIAAHMGIFSGGVLAWCFPAYNAAYEKYSPGLVFLAKLIEAAEETGIKRIDLGQGPETYKTRFQSDTFGVAEGSVGGRTVNRLLRGGWIRTRDWAHSSPLQGTPLRVFRGLRNWMIQN